MANKHISIGNRMISDDSMPFFIAEIGINHNGDIQLAKRLIDAAFATGWECVKFQKREPDLAIPEHQKNTLRETPWGTLTYLDYKKYIEFGLEEYSYIDNYCKEKPILWTASPWDMPSLDFILEFNVPFIKLASATNGNKELIKAACLSRKPIIMSTGMCTQNELDMSVSLLEKYSNGDYILLHTNSVYPSKNDELNLRCIQLLQERYDCLVGYSGHEENLEPSVAAAVLGAKVIERHITISHELWGTDQKASLEINAMDMLYKRIHSVIRALGDKEKKISNEELEVRKKLRRE